MKTRHHIRTAVCEATALESLCQELSRVLAGLIVQPAATEGWSRARVMLAALPLTTEEYSISVNRLTSAEFYTTSRELGAARFELTQLTRKLDLLGKDRAYAKPAGGASAGASVDG
jgi:hypothetical protein